MWGRRMAWGWALMGLWTIGSLFTAVIFSVTIRALSEQELRVLASETARAFSGNQFTPEAMQSAFLAMPPLPTSVDVEHGEGVWMQIYAPSKTVVLSTLKQGRSLAEPSVSVDFLETKEGGLSRRVWKTEQGTKHVLYLASFDGVQKGMVVVGQSVRPFADVVWVCGWMIFGGWIFGLVVVGVMMMWHNGVLMRQKVG